MACIPLSAAWAEDVTIKSHDGSVEVTGEIASFNENFIIMHTDLGDMRVQMGPMECIGADCPPLLNEVLAQYDDHDEDIDIASFDFSVNMIAPVGIADILLPVLAQGVAEDFNATVFAADGFGQPLADDIGRPGAGGHGHGDHDDTAGKPHSVDDHEAKDIVDIQLLSEAGNMVERLGVLIEEGNEILHLSKSEADLIFLDHPATEDEINSVAFGGGGNISADGQERVVAVEGLVVAVSPENPIGSVPASAIPAIFAGDITNWSDIGGPDAPIHLYSFGEDNAAFHYIEEMILHPAGIEMGDSFTEVDKMRDLAAKIYSDPLAIGVVPFANLRGTRPVPIEASCGIVSTPTEFTIKTEEYTMQRRYHAYNRADVSEATQAFLNFLDTEHVDDLVRKAGFVDLSVDQRSMDNSSSRVQNVIATTTDPYEATILKDLLSEMSDMDRLSTNFRFAFGSSRLDVRARADVRRVVDYIIENKPTELKLVGFTDSVGSFEANQTLASNRANTIRSTILASLPADVASNITISNYGFGELAPVACNDGNNGRRINRRVEIWVR